jgi:hypothetical protein
MASSETCQDSLNAGLPAALAACKTSGKRWVWLAPAHLTQVPATAYMYSGCAAVHACVKTCLREGAGWGRGLTVYCMLVPSLFTVQQ